MCERPALPADDRAARQRRLVRLVEGLFFLCGQLGLLLLICQWAGAPQWVFAIIFGLGLLGCIVVVRLSLVLLRLWAASHQPASETEDVP